VEAALHPSSAKNASQMAYLLRAACHFHISIEEEDAPESTNLSPSHAVAGSLLGLIPMLSFEESVSSREGSDDDPFDPASVTVNIKRFRAPFSSLKEKWTKAFTEVETGYGLIVKDLQKLHQISVTQANNIGVPKVLGDKTPDTVWQGLFQVQQSVNSVASTVHAQASSIEVLTSDQTHLTQSIIALETMADDLSTSLSD
jgi:hypothetical protein